MDWVSDPASDAKVPCRFIFKWGCDWEYGESDPASDVKVACRVIFKGGNAWEYGVSGAASDVIIAGRAILIGANGDAVEWFKAVSVDGLLGSIVVGLKAEAVWAIDGEVSPSGCEGGGVSDSWVGLLAPFVSPVEVGVIVGASGKPP